MKEILGPENEILDLVNEKDEIVGVTTRKDAEILRLPSVRTINAFIQNPDGDLWIPRRSQFKRHLGGCLDFSIAGYVKSGESYDEAFMREMEEEIKIDQESINISLLGYLTPYEYHVSSFMKIYLVNSVKEPEYDLSEYSDATWIKPMDLINRLKTDKKAKSDLEPVVRLFFLKT